MNYYQRYTASFLGLLLALGLIGGLFYWTIWAVTQPSCTAEITVYEDGSWSGGRLISNGSVVDKNWDQRMTLWQWRPMVDGTECTLTLANQH